MAKWTGSWTLGRTMTTESGEERWVFVRMLDRVRYSITLDWVKNEDDALAEVAAWNRLGKVAYLEQIQQRASQVVTKAVKPQADHLQGLERRLKARKRSKRHIQNTLHYAQVWMDELGPKTDLRTVGKARLIAILDAKAPEDQPSKRNKLIVGLKNLCRYLESKGLLDPRDAPDRFLQVEKVAPARLTRRRDHTRATLEAAYAQIAPIEVGDAGGRPAEADQAQAVRDTVRLMLQYGLHHAEVSRLAACDPSTAIRPVEHEEIAGVISFYHQKKRAWHYVSIDAPSWAAVERLRARGHAPGDRAMRDYLQAASTRAGVERVLPSRLRHSWATLGRSGGRLVSPQEGGLTPEQMITVSGHTSTTTLTTHYDATVLNPMVVIPIALVSQHDPRPPGRHLKAVS